MRLTSFKARGFKSFADAVSFKVSGELVGIVGPNGCGKSNIVDAVRWVLGESRASLLRGNTLADVMFNGSQKREPADWCEVELGFDNSANNGNGGGMWAAYPEIIVRREVSRDGRQAYIINGNQVRRRDVVDLFRGTGVAPRGYGVVEQGMVSSVAEASPDELRLFMEEAADVSHYKERRRDSERRLAASGENLAQLRLLLDGLEKQIDALKRQARTARRYREYGEEINRLDALLILSQREAAKAELEVCRARLKEKETALKAMHTRQETLSNRLKASKTARTEAAAALEAAREQQAQAQQALAAAEQNMQNISEGKQLTHDRLQETEQEIVALSGQQQQLQDEAQQQAQQQTEAEARLKKDAGKGDTEKNELTRLQVERESAQAALDSARDALAQIEQQMQMATVRRQMIDERLTDIKTRLAEALSSLAALPAAETLSEETLPQEAIVTEAEQALAAARSRCADCTAAVAAADAVARERHSELAAVTAEIGTLNRMVQEDGGSEGERLAQVLQVDAGEWSRALDAALGVYSTAVAVEDISSHCREHDMPAAGHAIVETAALAQLPPAEATDAAEADGLVPLLQRLTVSDAQRQILSYWLADVYSAETEADALAARQSLTRAQRIVTRAGVVYGAHSLLNAGEARGGYDWQQRMREQAQQQEALQSSSAAATAEHEKARQALAAAQAESEQLEHALTEARQVLAQQQIEQQRRLEQARVRNERREELQQIHAALQEEENRFVAEKTELTKLFTAREKEQTAAAAAFEQQKENVADIMAALERCREMIQENDLLRRDLQRQVEALTRQRQETESKQRDNTERQQLLTRRQKDYQKEVQKHDETALRQVLTSCQRQLEICAAAVAEARGKEQAIETESGKLEEQREGLHNERERENEQLADERLQEQQRVLKVDYLNDALDELDMTNEQLQKLQEENPHEEGAGATWQSRIDELRGKRERLGAINFMADSELREQEGKLSELTEQKADIEKAIAELQSTIQRIDSETQTRLQTMFESVNREFAQLYQEFVGGEARLAMVGETILDSGFELKVRPPGKRLFPVRMLSGGEKAAAAVSFIFAILRLNPPPFCIMDEVDAPLDDNRSQRFVEMLQGISRTVQCLVVTHNKGTISSLPRLIGVTQEEAGASRVVSVTLSDALRAAK